MIDLGVALVEELGLTDSTDTLSRWMAHYIAGLIEDVENSPPDQVAERQERCAKAIVELWDHRSALPNGKRPFENLESVIKALDALSPDGVSRYYPRSLYSASDAPGAKEPSHEWLSAVERIDYAARVLIRYCLSRAAELAKDRDQEWVKLALAVAGGEDRDLRRIEVIIRTLDDSTDDPDKELKEALQAELDRLNGFFSAAEGVRADLLSRLQILSAAGAQP